MTEPTIEVSFYTLEEGSLQATMTFHEIFGDRFGCYTFPKFFGPEGAAKQKDT
jgi:hypothetical protein